MGTVEAGRMESLWMTLLPEGAQAPCSFVLTGGNFVRAPIIGRACSIFFFPVLVLAQLGRLPISFLKSTLAFHRKYTVKIISMSFKVRHTRFQFYPPLLY